MIAELERLQPGSADLLMELEADYDLRTRFEIELLDEDQAPPHHGPRYE